MESRERVFKTIEFQYPDKIPFEWYEFGTGRFDLKRSDIVGVDYNPLRKPVVYESDTHVKTIDEWGCTWVKIKSIPTIGQPLGHPLQEWESMEEYKFPELQIEKRFEGVDKEVKKFRKLGKYVLGYF